MLPASGEVVDGVDEGDCGASEGEAMNEQLPEDEIRSLADYLQGFAAATQNTKLSQAAEWLYQAANNVCAGGFFGCGGGRECTSDHK